MPTIRSGTMQLMTPPIVELQSVSKSYRGKCVLPGLDLAVQEGEFLTLLGPSGCGKTTALRLLAGFESPDSGVIRLDGVAINALPAARRPINTVFQSYALFPHMDVAANVGFGLRMQGLPPAECRRRVGEALALVRMTEYDTLRPTRLSGGQQQRVALARALVNRPRVLLLDESLNALDYRLRKAMQSELKALQRRLGLTFIFVTHDQEEALSVSDRVAVMRDGIIQQIGSPRQIYQNPVNLFVAGFVGESNILPGLVVDAGTAGRVDVRVEQRTLSLRTPLVLRSGDTVHLLIRPEDVRVARGEGLPAATDSCQPQLWLDGVVTEKTYKGVTVETAIRLESGRMLTACEFINGGVLNADDGAGQRVRIGWMANRETLLPVDAT